MNAEDEPKAGLLAQPIGALRQAVPGQRSVRRVVPTSVAGVLAKMVPLLLRADWNPSTSARVLSEHVHGDPAPLRATRAHLLVATADRTTLIDLRAIATLNLAISHVQEARETDRDG